MKPVITQKFSYLLILCSVFIGEILHRIVERIGGPIEDVINEITMMLSISMTIFAWKTTMYIKKNLNQTNSDLVQEK